MLDLWFHFPAQFVLLIDRVPSCVVEMLFSALASSITIRCEFSTEQGSTLAVYLTPSSFM